MPDFIVAGSDPDASNRIGGKLARLGFDALVVNGHGLPDNLHPIAVLVPLGGEQNVQNEIFKIKTEPGREEAAILGVIKEEDRALRAQAWRAGCSAVLYMDAPDEELKCVCEQQLHARRIKTQLENQQRQLTMQNRSFEDARRNLGKQFERTKTLNRLLKKQVFVLESLKGLTEVITSSLDFNEVKRLLLLGIHETLKFDAVALFEYHPAADCLELTSFQGDAGAESPVGTKIGRSNAKHIFETFNRRNEKFLDPAELELEEYAFFRKLGIRRFAAAPLVSRSLQMHKEKSMRGSATDLRVVTGAEARDDKAEAAFNPNSFMGCILVGNRERSRPIEFEDIEFLNAFAAQATITISNSFTYTDLENKNRIIMHDLVRAETIQRNLLPRDFPEVAQLKFAAYYKSSALVGGDYYDTIWLSEKKAGVIVADVTGHGASAALTTSMVKILVSLFAPHCSPAELLVKINEILSDHLIPGDFISLAYFVIDAREGTLTYSFAGHPPALLYRRATGEALELRTESGFFIGIAEDGRYVEKTENIGPGDTLLLYTDGLTEAQSSAREQFGLRRLRALLDKYRERAPYVMLDRIIGEACRFHGSEDFDDDVTMVAVQRFSAQPLFLDAEPADLERIVLDIEIPADMREKDEHILEIEKLLLLERLMPGRHHLRVRLCLDELITNSIVHGSQNDLAKKIRLHLSADRDYWMLKVRDEGDGFAPGQITDPTTRETILLEHGRGVFILRQFMDEVSYFDGGRGIVILKRIVH